MKYTKEVETAIKRSKKMALENNSDKIRPEHLFLALLEGDNDKNDEYTETYRLFRDMNLNIDPIKQTIREWSIAYQNQFSNLSTDRKRVIKLDVETNKILEKSINFAEELESNEVGFEHVLLSILDNNNLVTELFKKSPSVLKTLISRLRNEDIDDEFDNMYNDNDENDRYMEEEPRGIKKESNKNSKTKLIDQFGTDLTKLAKENVLDPIVGRKKEIKRISQILSRRKKNNPVLVGEPGVGKSAIAEGLAKLIVDGTVPENLKDKKIITLDMGSLVAGTKYRGEFEQRLRGIMKEMENNRNIILFIDEIHTIIGAGSASGSLDASNMLKPALSRGVFQCIGATTLEEYRKYIEKDGALERRFQKITVEPTTKSETEEILKNIKDRYEDYHLVKYTPEAIEACVNLTDKYMSEKFLPDKAIDALDEAGSMVHVNKHVSIPKKITDLEKEIKNIFKEKERFVRDQKFEMAAEKRDTERELTKKLENEREIWRNEQSKNRDLVTKEHISEVVSLMTKIPLDSVSVDENNKLKKLAENVKSIVIGQDDAVNKLVRSVKRARIGIKDPSKPVGSFVFLGPTGVGKTYLAKIMAKNLFGSEDSMIRIDMSEYMEKYTVSRLVGSPPGYVGYEDGGELTEAVRRKPYSIILFDEIEKAHPDVQNILLQVLDDGVLTDSYGRRVDFKNTIIVMTSNAGSKKLKEFGTGIGFNSNSGDAQKNKNYVIKKELEKIFSPEFLNRIDEIINFNSLTKEDIGRIVDVELDLTLKRLTDIGYSVNITKSLKDFIFENGYDEKYGARPLKRSIQKNIEDVITDAIINEEISEGDRISLRYDEKLEEVKIIKLKNSKKLRESDNLLSDNNTTIKS